MAVQLSTEQKEFQATLRAFLADACPGNYIRKRIESNLKRDENFLARLGELGLSEYFEDKQSGASAIELWIIAFESGRGLLPEHSALEILCGPYARSAGIESSQGSLTILDSKLAESFSVSANGAQIAAEFHHVPGYGDSTGAFVLGLKEDEMFYGDLTAAPQARESALDISRSYSSVTLKNAPFKAVAASTAIKLRSVYRVICGAEIAGACSSAVNMTLAHCKQREQFGVPIGGFQAVQQKMADMHLQAEAIRALSLFAAWTVDNDERQLPLAALSAATFASDSGPEVIERAIQAHGGIGFTWEYDLHLYLRRVRQLAATLGGSGSQATQVLAYAREESGA